MGITEGITRETPEHGAQELAQVWDAPAPEDTWSPDHVGTWAEFVEAANRRSVQQESGK